MTRKQWQTSRRTKEHSVVQNIPNMLIDINEIQSISSLYIDFNDVKNPICFFKYTLKNGTVLRSYELTLDPITTTKTTWYGKTQVIYASNFEDYESSEKFIEMQKHLNLTIHNWKQFLRKKYYNKEHL